MRGGCSVHEWERERCRIALRKGTGGGGVGVRGYVVQDTYGVGCESVLGPGGRVGRGYVATAAVRKAVANVSQPPRLRI